MDHKTELFTKYACLQANSWGMGDSLKEAKSNCREAGGMGKRIDFLAIATVPFIKPDEDYRVSAASVDISEIDGGLRTTNCKCIKIQ